MRPLTALAVVLSTIASLLLIEAVMPKPEPLQQTRAIAQIEAAVAERDAALLAAEKCEARWQRWMREDGR